MIFISLVYPTYKREERVRHLIAHYSKLKVPGFEVVFSNNDSSISFEDDFKSDEKFLFVDNKKKKERVGDNICNGLTSARGEFSIIMSDEDVLIGLAELISFIEINDPDVCVLPVLIGNEFRRSYSNSRKFNDIIFHGTGSFTGICFKKSTLNTIDFNFLLRLDNNDYVHQLLIGLIADKKGTFAMLNTACILSQVSCYEGKNGAIKERAEWFFVDGRVAQSKSFMEVAKIIQHPEVQSMFKNRAKLKVVYVSCYSYGIWATFKAFRRKKLLHLFIPTFAAYIMFSLRSFATSTTLSFRVFIVGCGKRLIK
jgi:hypothetical protein